MRQYHDNELKNLLKRMVIFLCAIVFHSRAISCSRACPKDLFYILLSIRCVPQELLFFSLSLSLSDIVIMRYHSTLIDSMTLASVFCFYVNLRWFNEITKSDTIGAHSFIRSVTVIARASSSTTTPTIRLCSINKCRRIKAINLLHSIFSLTNGGQAFYATKFATMSTIYEFILHFVFSFLFVCFLLLWLFLSTILSTVSSLVYIFLYNIFDCLI